MLSKPGPILGIGPGPIYIIGPGPKCHMRLAIGKFASGPLISSTCGELCLPQSPLGINFKNWRNLSDTHTEQHFIYTDLNLASHHDCHFYTICERACISKIILVISREDSEFMR